MRRPSIGIAWKLIGGIAGSLILVFGVLIFFLYNYQRSHLESTVINSGVNINETIRRTIIHNMMNSNCGTAFEVIHALADDLPLIICDAGQIQQIFVALLINASEAIGHGGVIDVSTQFNAESEQIVFECADNGLGMDDETRRKIFEPFFTTKESSNGSGLGLAVVYGIVQRHGGTIDVESSPGKGARFIVKLPLEPPRQADSFEDIPITSQPDRL